MFKFGLKLWSTNSNYVTEAVRLFDEGVYQYIELYAAAHTYNEHIHVWKGLNIPFLIHAPHSYGGMNLAKKENRGNNALLLNETIKFADTLKADIIIVHPGIAGDIGETVHQIKKVDDSRIVIENKPYYTLDQDLICNGNSVEEITFALDQTGAGFCLDIGHAICAANARGKEPLDYMKQFFQLKPKIHHLSDGDYSGVKDEHRHFGKGNFRLGDILALIPDGSLVTIETGKDFEDSLIDFQQDIEYLLMQQRV